MMCSLNVGCYSLYIGCYSLYVRCIDAIWDVASSMHDEHALCGMLCPLFRMHMRYTGCYILYLGSYILYVGYYSLYA